ncbi:MAG: STAS domain-containing protein [Candidatus Riflebacteria bacterium]|nr:STAS domain-containing protein [Candidatus Riflebacteria bacterium]
MQININNVDSNGVLNVSIEGSIDTLTAQDFENQITKALEGVKELILDFGKVQYVSSAGLRAILGLNTKMEDQGKMVIKNIDESVRDVFEMTGFDELLNLE